MDNGAWIVFMMLGGTAIVCLFAGFTSKASSSHPVVQVNGWRTVSDELKLTIDVLQRENRALKDENFGLQAEMDRINIQKVALERGVDYWRTLALQATKNDED